MPVVFSKCIAKNRQHKPPYALLTKRFLVNKRFTNSTWSKNYSGCYADLLFPVLCALLFSENNRQFGAYCSFCISSGLTCFSKTNLVHLLILLYCSHHVFNKRTHYRKNNASKCLRLRINAKIELLNKDIFKFRVLRSRFTVLSAGISSSRYLKLLPVMRPIKTVALEKYFLLQF